MGQCRGNLQTLNATKNVSTSFYKLIFNTSNGTHAVLCLETSNLGDYYGINHKMSLNFSTHFGLSPDDLLCTSSKPIDILLGLDATVLLLDKIFVLNGKKISPQDGRLMCFYTVAQPVTSSHWWAGLMCIIRLKTTVTKIKLLASSILPTKPI